MPLFNDLKIADDMQHEQILKGIQPKHQNCFKFYKISRFFAIGLLGLSIIGLICRLIDSDRLKGITSSEHFPVALLLLVLGAIIAGLLAVVTKTLFLRKAPFDDWVFDIAQKRLGTDVIFYDSKRLYIQYDRSGKEVDKREFVTEMSDKSVHYSYFYVKTYIDEGVIVVECTKRQPIPNRASFKPEDDKYWNVLPLGLTIHPVLQTVAPMGWYLNDQNKNPDLLETIPSTSILICGGTGCYAEDTPILMYNNIVSDDAVA